MLENKIENDNVRTFANKTADAFANLFVLNNKGEKVKVSYKGLPLYLDQKSTATSKLIAYAKANPDHEFTLQATIHVVGDAVENDDDFEF